ncbi:hypothetical protein T4A_14258 [Trichinella pseudospiralis]|uniref:Uncharacterized protein n=1 Tax=Trichinella pseudospiralis TaxID=6337 RepID=A0A0V1E2J8_TRIPS|nr:hypothetical protein T4A_14258 [Trichinella pseudospiralis]
MNKENQVQENQFVEQIYVHAQGWSGPEAKERINNAEQTKARQRGMTEKTLRKYVGGTKNQN